MVEARQVTADVGGNLNIESRQDTSSAQSRQSSSGVSLSLGIPPICYGISTVSGNVAKAKAEGDFQSVGEQSGIKAGDGGFKVDVKGDTNLKGAVIESAQVAIDAKNNSFKTGGALTLSDLENYSKSDAKGYSVSGSVGTAVGDQSTATTEAAKRAAANAGANSVPGGGAGVGEESTRQASVTRSGISGMAGDESVRTGDTSSAGTLVKAWDTQAAIKDVQNQAQVNQQFSQNAAREIGSYANGKREEAKKPGDMEEAAKWDEGGEYRVALHVVAGGLTGQGFISSPGPLGAMRPEPLAVGEKESTEANLGRLSSGSVVSDELLSRGTGEHVVHLHA